MRLSRGFTILEILVVVAVISLIASTILLNTSFGKPQDQLDRHTRDIGKTLRLLLVEAIINDSNFALSLVPGGYLVLEGMIGPRAPGPLLRGSRPSVRC